ncbi:MAG: hypothetical protein R3F59_36695 [Myxococcota bacterium]
MDSWPTRRTARSTTAACRRRIAASAAALSPGARRAAPGGGVLGGFGLEAAQAVLGDVRGLEEPVDADLVRLDDRGRYQPPGPVAAWAEPDEDAERAHGAWFAARVGAWEPPLVRAVPELRAEAADLEVALESGAGGQGRGAGGSVALGLAAARSPGLVLGALESGRPPSPRGRPGAAGAGGGLREQGRCEPRRAPAAGAGRRAPAHADRRGPAGSAGRTATPATRPPRRRACCAASATPAPALRTRVLGALALAHAADLDPARSRDEYREALGLARQVGDRGCEDVRAHEPGPARSRCGQLAAAQAGMAAALAVQRDGRPALRGACSA